MPIRMQTLNRYICLDRQTPAHTDCVDMVHLEQIGGAGRILALAAGPRSAFSQVIQFGSQVGPQKTCVSLLHQT